jgi:hypothetical protein
MRTLAILVSFWCPLLAFHSGSRWWWLLLPPCAFFAFGSLIKGIDEERERRTIGAHTKAQVAKWIVLLVLVTLLLAGAAGRE